MKTKSFARLDHPPRPPGPGLIVFAVALRAVLANFTAGHEHSLGLGATVAPHRFHTDRLGQTSPKLLELSSVDAESLQFVG